jgi:hypothetical protein
MHVGDTTAMNIMRVRQTSRLACCAIIVAAILVGSPLEIQGAKAVKKTPVRVLFLGNSYTYAYQLPDVVAAMAAADKTVPPMEVKMVASGGKTLMWHASNKASLAAIAEGKWDYVVLQDQSLTPTLMPQRSLAGARVLDAAIKKAGAKTMFFMTWQRQPTPQMLKQYPDMHNRNSKTYMSMARELKAAVAPVGYAWKTAIDTIKKCPIYARDGSHPSLMGTYLTACVFYAAIYNKPPTRIPAKVVLSKEGNKKTVLGVPSGYARRFQLIAWKAVQQATKELTPKPAPKTK